MTLAAGSTLAQFKILAKLGEGGMGEVWRARDTKLGRQVAIKVLPAEMAADPERLDRFKREARSVAALNHPNIVTIHSVDEADGVHFMEMELIDGQSLDRKLPQGGLGLARLFELAIPIADALSKAHAAGITHRDLKPANVMEDADGRVKILDFGLVKLAEKPGDADDTELLTREGAFLGTVGYMSPEQVQGQAVDHRSDVFSLGILLYEMATGERPFHGQDPASFISSLMRDVPRRVTDLKADLPQHLGRIVRRCLEKDPARRYQSARDVQIELEELQMELTAESDGWQRGPGVDKAPFTARRRDRRATGPTLSAVAGLVGRSRSLPWLIAAAAIVGAIAALSVPPQTSDDLPRGTIELAITPPAGGEIRLGNGVGWGVISPDGSQVAFVASTDEGQGLWVRRLESDDPRLLPGTEGGYYPFWSPDGRWLAFFDPKGILRKVEIGGDRPVEICKALYGRGGSWGEDGSILMTPLANGNLHRVPAAGGEPVPVTELDPDRHENAHYWPQLLPGGSSCLYFVRSGREEFEGIYLGTFDEEGREADRRRLVASSSSGLFVPDDRGSSSGHLIWARDGRLVARAFALDRGEFTGDAVDLEVPVRVMDSHRAAMISASDNGVLVASPIEPVLSQVVWYDRSGAGPTVLGMPNGGMWSSLLAPDGRSLALALVRQGDSDIWRHDLETGASNPLTTGDTWDNYPVWSPDSRSLVYNSILNTGSPLYRLFRLDVDGGSGSSLVIETGASPFSPQSWTREGLIVGSYRGEDGFSRMAAIDLKEPTSVQVLSDQQVGDEAQVDVSPDGRWIAWIGSDSKSRGTSVSALHSIDGVPSLGPSQTIALEGAVSTFWSPSGEELFVLGQNRMLYSVPVSSDDNELRLGPSEPLFRKPSSPPFGRISVSPDGRRFYFTIEPGAPTRTLRVLLNWKDRLGA